jgi:hypothetical protein
LTLRLFLLFKEGERLALLLSGPGTAVGFVWRL